MSESGRHGIVREFQGAPLPDKRLRSRLEQIVQSVKSRPDSGFPQVFPNEAELEAFYRFVRNDRVDWQSVLEPHARETVLRAAGYETVLVAHDTSEFRFGGKQERAGLTRGRSKAGGGARAKQGFWCHFALAVAPDEHRSPLGVIAMEPWARTEISPTSLKNAGGSEKEISKLPSEQERWGRLVDEVEEQLDRDSRAVHIMDSEADDYALLAKLTQQRARFVIRACYDRRLVEQDETRGRKLREFVASGQQVCTREVKVSGRLAPNGRPTKRGASRKERTATLSYGAERLLLRRPDKPTAKGISDSVAINVVYVQELEPPEGELPIEWLLLTTEPIETETDILRVVDYYRARWRIEELFKAIKSGCAYEKRQMESFETLLVALAIFVPVAWQMLTLRALSRAEPKLPAETCLSRRQLRVLRLASKKALPEKPTVRDALLQIARLGGHLKRNGPPGWQTLGRGFLELLALERGFALASQLEM